MSPPDPSPDKRRNTRLTSPKVVVRIPSVDRFRTHYLKDISEGGLFVKAEQVLAVGALLSLELWPPGWDHALEISAKVTRSTDPKTAAQEGRPCGMAVQFVSVPPEIAHQLEGLVEEHHRAEAAADPVGAQVAALVQELSAAREKLGAMETELMDVRGQNEALTEQVETLQREELEARTAAAKLGEERTNLESRVREVIAKALADQAKAAEQLSAARRDAEATARKVEEEKEESRRQRARADQLAAQLDEEKQRGRSDRERAERLAGDLGKREAREKDLRRLLDRVTAPTPTIASLVEDEEVVVVSGSEPLDAGLAATPAPPPAPPPSKAGSEPEIDLDVGDLDLGEPSAQDDAAALFDDPTNVPSGDPEGFATFSDGLKAKTRVMGTEELIGFEPANDDEKLVVELIGAAPTFATLIAQVEGRLAEGRLRRILFDFDRRKLVELRT
ncbi:MAG TPA: PilZ domain-containing protein [Myxococcales bacterium]|nr:PilZ domain-containing protein [Myxococcales bacterium]